MVRGPAIGRGGASVPIQLGDNEKTPAGVGRPRSWFSCEALPRHVFARFRIRGPVLPPFGGQGRFAARLGKAPCLCKGPAFADSRPDPHVRDSVGMSATLRHPRVLQAVRGSRSSRTRFHSLLRCCSARFLRTWSASASSSSTVGSAGRSIAGQKSRGDLPGPVSAGMTWFRSRGLLARSWLPTRAGRAEIAYLLVSLPVALCPRSCGRT